MKIKHFFIRPLCPASRDSPLETTALVVYFRFILKLCFYNCNNNNGNEINTIAKNNNIVSSNNNKINK